MEREYKEVTKEEFETFIKNYPRKLKSDFFMGWLDYYDFPSENYEPKDLDDLFSHKVARNYCGMGGDEYYVMIEPKEAEIKPPCGVKELLAERKRTNQQMLATISAEEFYDKIIWLFHDYGKRYSNSRLSITEWLDSEVEE